MTENTNPTPEAESELTGQFTRAGQQIAELTAQFDAILSQARTLDRARQMEDAAVQRRAARARKSALMDAWELLMDAGQTEAAALIRVMWDA